MSGLLRFILGGDLFARWTGPTPFGLSLSKPSSFSISRLSDESGAALSPRRATYISLLRQRNLRKRRATLVSASLRFAAGNLRCSVQPGSPANSPAAQTSTSPSPSGPVLLGAFTRVRGKKSGSDSGTDSGHLGLCIATIFIAAPARIAWARGLNHLKVGSAAWFWGRYRDFAAQHPQDAPHAWRIRTLTSKTPDPAPSPASDPIPTAVWQGRAAQRQADKGRHLFEPQASFCLTPPAASSAGNPKGPDFGSPSLCLLSLGDARESESPAAATERLRSHQKTQRSIQHKASTGSARTGLEYGFDTHCVPCPELVRGSARTENSSSKLQSPTPC
jgi:hypothetical protein